MLFISIFISSSTAVYRHKLCPRKKGNEIKFCLRHLFRTTVQDRVLQLPTLSVQSLTLNVSKVLGKNPIHIRKNEENFMYKFYLYIFISLMYICQLILATNTH